MLQRALCLLGLVAVASTTELLLQLPESNTKIALSTTGDSAFRVRLLPTGSGTPISTPMVAPESPDATFTIMANKSGITAPGLGSLALSASSELFLADASGAIITHTAPLAGQPHDICAAQEGTDVTGGDRAAAPTTVASQAECCAYCKNASGCIAWIYGHPGDAEGNCWAMRTVTGTRAAAGRTLGGKGAGSALRLSSSDSAQLYGRGAGKSDATSLTTQSGSAYVDNTVVMSPHFYSTDGFASLAVVNSTTGNGKTNVLPVSYSMSGGFVSWSFPADGSPFELYLMPAASLDGGTAAFYSLTGRPAVPPRYAFGFLASRWGWQNRSYIEWVLKSFRDGGYPIDAFIGDFGWSDAAPPLHLMTSVCCRFTNVSDYSFPPQGFPWYDDFGFSSSTFPDPQQQLSEYKSELNIRMGGIRKPRLGNTALLNEARAKGFLLPGGELVQGVEYADQRNIDFGQSAAREWYVEHQKHYINDGVSFFW